MIDQHNASFAFATALKERTTSDLLRESQQVQ
jgi:hypothetical protein